MFRLGWEAQGCFGPRSINISLSVGTMSSWVDGVWEWDFRWRHRLFVWKLLLVVELLVVADGRQLPKGVDSWSWNLSSDGVYSIQYAYGSLSNDTLGECGRVLELSHLLVWVWRSWAPSKIQDFFVEPKWILYNIFEILMITRFKRTIGHVNVCSSMHDYKIKF